MWGANCDPYIIRTNLLYLNDWVFDFNDIIQTSDSIQINTKFFDKHLLEMYTELFANLLDRPILNHDENFWMKQYQLIRYFETDYKDFLNTFPLKNNNTVSKIFKMFKLQSHFPYDSLIVPQIFIETSNKRKAKRIFSRLKKNQRALDLHKLKNYLVGLKDLFPDQINDEVINETISNLNLNNLINY